MSTKLVWHRTPWPSAKINDVNFSASEIWVATLPDSNSVLYYAYTGYDVDGKGFFISSQVAPFYDIYENGSYLQSLRICDFGCMGKACWEGFHKEGTTQEPFEIGFSAYTTFFSYNSSFYETPTSGMYVLHRIGTGYASVSTGTYISWWGKTPTNSDEWWSIPYLYYGAQVNSNWWGDKTAAKNGTATSDLVLKARWPRWRYSGTLNPYSTNTILAGVYSPLDGAKGTMTFGHFNELSGVWSGGYDTETAYFFNIPVWRARQ